MSIKFTTVQDGELLKFNDDTKGQKFTGLLESHEEKPTGKGVGHVYQLKTEGGTLAFFAPSLLHKKLQSHVGDIVEIVYEGEAKTKIGNTIKNFNVGSAPASESNLKAIGVSIFKKEDEIPFE